MRGVRRAVRFVRTGVRCIGHAQPQGPARDRSADASAAVD
jgi:hypothetical protein